MGPMQEVPKNKLFYTYAPTIQWHRVQFVVEDGLARATIDRLADEAFCFGCQIEECECQLLQGLVNMEQCVSDPEKKKIEAL